MSQSALLVASLLALFVVFLAARGRLATYASVFYGPKPDSSPSGGKSGGGSGGTMKTVAEVAQVAAAFA